MLEIGQRIKTNYGTGPYKITSIVRGCTCKAPTDFFDEGPDMPPHIHLALEGVEDGKEYWLGWYDEETLRSVTLSGDRIILLNTPEPIQRSLISI